MASDYYTFLDSKRLKANTSGFDGIDPSRLNPVLFPFQRDVTLLALKKGRFAAFLDTGLGKTPIQVEWARIIHEETGRDILIIAPLSVARQTVKIAKDLLGVDVHYVRSQEQAQPGINITNYEMIEHFEFDRFGGVVLDESSILKGLDGKIRRYLTDACAYIPYRLACTATPAPNDIVEIANHAEWLGIMTISEMKAAFFVNSAPKDPITGKKKEGGQDKWRLRGHAKEKFFRWLASWSISIRKPSDLGYSDEGYDLPPLNIHKVIVPSNYRPEGQLFFMGLKGIQDRTAVRKATMDVRAAKAAEIVAENEADQWIVWTGLIDESHLITSTIPGAVEVEGSDSIEYKIKAIEGFQDGQNRVLITKSKIAGMGMNFQNCHKMLFLGMSDSWESYYQSIRRCYRFGQTHPVDVYIVLSDAEEEIYYNVMSKEKEAKAMSEELIKQVQGYELEELAGAAADEFEYETDMVRGEDFVLRLGDSVERLKELPDESVDLSVYSPPFNSLYTYSPTERDLGNSRTMREFLKHYSYIVRELLRVTKPGRITAVHVADTPAMLIKDGYIGMKDFSGKVIKLYEACGWIFDARIPIDKNQQAQSIRTHSKALTMSQLEKDRSWLRPALPDYILKFRKPGENVIPVVGGDVNRDQWIEFAAPTWPNWEDRTKEIGSFPTWYGIAESDTLQGWQKARDNADERHVAPLQLGTIQRCIRLWSNKGETVLDPFNGIGSTGWEAIRLGRKYTGIELKPSYFRMAVKNLRQAEATFKTPDLFSLAGIKIETSVHAPAD
jgi:DNA modification methylase